MSGLEPPRLSFLLRYRAPILLLLLCTSAFFAWKSRQLRFDFSPQQLFETVDTDPAWRLWQDTIERFGRDDLTLFVVLDAGEGEDVLKPRTRTWLALLADAMADNRDVKEVTSVARMTTVRGQGDTLEILDARSLSSDELARDPLLRGSLFSADRTLAVTLLKLDPARRKVDLLRPMVNGVDRWLQAHPPPSPATAKLAGIPFIRVDVADSLRADQMKFLPITLGVLALLLVFVFRTFTRMLLPLITVGLSVVWITGTMVILDAPVDIINNVVPSLLLVIGLSDGLHLLTRARAETQGGLSPIAGLDRSVRHLAAACFFTSITSAIGFASLLFSSTRILRVFGGLAALGILVAYGLTLGVLPQALSFTRKVMSGPPLRTAWLTRFAMGLSGRSLRHPRMTLLLCAFLTAGAGTLGLMRVHPNVHLTEVYGPMHPVRVLQHTLDQKLGGVLPMDLLLRFPDAGSHRDPERLAQVARLQARVAAIPGVTYTRSVADLASALHRAVAGAPAGTLPTTRDLLAQEWLLGEMGREPLDLSPYISDDGALLRIFLRTADIGGRRAGELQAEVKRLGREVFGPASRVSVELTGDAYVASRNMTALIRDLFRSLSLASVFIFVVLLVAFRSLKLALLAIWPNALPLLVCLGVMGLFGLDLDVSNVVIFSIALGLAVDDTIHVIARFREELTPGEDPGLAIERTMRGTGQAVVLSSVVLGAGMLVLTTSSFLLTARFGALAAFTLGVALIADLALLPVLLRLAYSKTR